MLESDVSVVAPRAPGDATASSALPVAAMVEESCRLQAAVDEGSV